MHIRRSLFEHWCWYDVSFWAWGGFCSRWWWRGVLIITFCLLHFQNNLLIASNTKKMLRTNYWSFRIRLFGNIDFSSVLVILGGFLVICNFNLPCCVPYKLMEVHKRQALFIPNMHYGGYFNILFSIQVSCYFFSLLCSTRGSHGISSK